MDAEHRDAAVYEVRGTMINTKILVILTAVMLFIAGCAEDNQRTDITEDSVSYVRGIRADSPVSNADIEKAIHDGEETYKNIAIREALTKETMLSEVNPFPALDVDAALSFCNDVPEVGGCDEFLDAYERYENKGLKTPETEDSAPLPKGYVEECVEWELIERHKYREPETYCSEQCLDAELKGSCYPSPPVKTGKRIGVDEALASCTDPSICEDLWQNYTKYKASGIEVRIITYDCSESGCRSYCLRNLNKTLPRFDSYNETVCTKYLLVREVTR